MQCKDVRETILAYLSDSLGNRKRAEIEAHLASCPDCAEYCDSLYAVESRLRASFNEQVDLPSITDSVMAALPVSQAKSHPWRRWSYALGMLTTMVVLAIVIWTNQFDMIVEQKQTAEHKTLKHAVTEKPQPVTRDEPTAQIVSQLKTQAPVSERKPRTAQHIAHQAPVIKQKLVNVAVEDQQIKPVQVDTEKTPVIIIEEPVVIIAEQGAPTATEDGVSSSTKILVVASNNSTTTRVHKHTSTQILPEQDAGDIERYELRVIEEPLTGRGGI